MTYRTMAARCVLVMGLPVLVMAQGSGGQAPAPQTFSDLIKAQHATIKLNITQAAEKMPEEHYSFRPTPEVRSFGELIGHLANANYNYCSRATGEANPNQGTDWEKTTAKADLVKALQGATAYCDTIVEKLTDTSAVAMITAPGPNNTTRQVARVNGIVQNVTHNNDHYGNIVTYMRLKGLVPPSTERAQARP